MTTRQAEVQKTTDNNMNLTKPHAFPEMQEKHEEQKGTEKETQTNQGMKRNTDMNTQGQKNREGKDKDRKCIYYKIKQEITQL